MAFYVRIGGLERDFGHASGMPIMQNTTLTGLHPRGVAIQDLDGQGGAEVLVTLYGAGELRTCSWNDGKLNLVQELPNFDKPVGVAAGSLKTGWPLARISHQFS
jgi:hypothetical protein